MQRSHIKMARKVVTLDMLEHCDMRPLDHRYLKDRRSSIERRRDIVQFPQENERRMLQRRIQQRRN